MVKYPFIQQHDEKDCGAACLSMVSEHYGRKLPIAKCRRLIKVDNQGANIYGLVTGADMIGLDAEALEGTIDELSEGITTGEISFPLVARIINDEMFEHFIVVYGIKKGLVIVGDPGKNGISRMPLEQFAEQWQGQIITFFPNKNFEVKDERKGAFRKFFRYIILQKWLLIFVFAISLVVSIINVSGAVIFKYIISDTLEMTNTEKGDLDSIPIYNEQDKKYTYIEDSHSIRQDDFFSLFASIDTVCIIIILLYVFRACLNNIRGYLLALVTKKVDVSLTLIYYNHLVDLPIDFYGTMKTGEFMSRFYDISKIRDAISTTTLTIMLDTIMATACGVLLCCINKTLFLITLLVVIIYAFIVFLFRKPIKLINHELMEQEAKVTSFLKESIDGIETVKAYQNENVVKQKLNELYEQFTNKSVKGSFVYNFQDSIVSLAASIGMVVLLWVGTYLCIDNVIDIAELFIFYYLINFFLDPIANLINLQPELQTAIVASERLNDILDAETEECDSKKENLGSMYKDIKIENLDFRYGNRELVLHDVNMEFGKGKKIAIVGESGCGKTTIAKLLFSFYYPEWGNVTIEGKNLSEYSVSSIRKHMAYISQDVFLFSDTIYNNLRCGNDSVTEEEVRDAARQCGIDDYIMNLPLGYNTILEENGKNLSGGQKQRIAIARALLKKPDIMIMDEATSNLDTVTEKSIGKVIESLSGKMTCIIISHRMNIIENCDYIYVMDKGRIVEQGTHQSLLNNGGIYHKLVHCK